MGRGSEFILVQKKEIFQYHWACTRISSNYLKLFLPLCIDVWWHSYLMYFHLLFIYVPLLLIPKLYKCLSYKCYKLPMLPPTSVKVLIPYKCYSSPCSQVLTDIKDGLYPYQGVLQKWWKVPLWNLSSKVELSITVLFNWHELTFHR